MTSLIYDATYTKSVEFNDSPIERHMSVAWSYLTLNWGRLEYYLYMTVEPVSPELATEWMFEFFATSNNKNKMVKVRERINMIFGDDPVYLGYLNDTLEMFLNLSEQRNQLVHGLWVRKSEGRFEVQPLRVDKNALVVETPISIEINQLRELNKLFDAVISRFAQIGTEADAVDYLNKIEARKKRAAATKN